jgi:single-stranded-DNA-specific exonuclease
MKRETSIKGNTIIYHPETLSVDMRALLHERMHEDDVAEKTLADLHDPYLLAGMTQAVARIKQAKEKNERVIIFGDYDVDGVTSTSILMHLFKKLDFQVSYRVPHRVHDGYGMKTKFIDELAPLWVTLIITVDCGTRDVEVVKYAKQHGIDIIITDHHAVPDIIPDEAVALINPKRKDCNYPFKDLSGAGVAYKLMMAVAREYMDEISYQKYLQESIDIAAIGTVADCMILKGENRIIVREWLKQLKKSRSKGIRALIEDKIHEDLDADIFWFVIGPRLNAAGRMSTPYKAVNLILNNGASLDETLREIEELNTKRKSATADFVERALEEVNPQDNIIFYHSPEIEHGIIGIVAGRLTEKYYKPSIVLIDEGDKLIASCRSPEYFSIVEILERYADSFVAFGGHKQAAGFTILKEKFADFESRIVAELNALDFAQYHKEILVDKSIHLDEIGFKLLESMNRFKPFGMGNPKPLFIVEDFTPEKIAFLGQGRDHLRFDTRYGFKVFAFGFGEYFEALRKQKSFHLIFDLSEDSWNGKRGLMMKVVDIVLP